MPRSNVDIRKIKLDKITRKIMRLHTQKYHSYRNKAFSALNEEVEIERTNKEPGMPGAKSKLLDPTSLEALNEIDAQSNSKKKSRAALIKYRALNKAIEMTLDNEYAGNEKKKNKTRVLMKLVLFKGYTHEEAVIYGENHEDCQKSNKRQIRYLKTLYYYFLNEILDETLLKGGF